LRLTNLRYSSGEGNVLEVVDSENTLVSAETSRADGAARYFNALANLQTLTGSMPQ
jgi:outer membrane protein TolC